MTVGLHDDRFRRQLLRGAVDENLETVAGKPRGTTRRLREQRVRRRRRIVTVTGACAAAVLTSAWIWSAIAGSPPTEATSAASPVDHQVPAPALVDDTELSRRMAENLATSEPRRVLAQAVPLAVQRVAVDAGHGGIDGGTSLRYGLLEKDLTRDIAARLSKLLESAGTEVVLTRKNDEKVSLKRRAEIANETRADLFVSIHVNWLPDATARGVEIYYLGPTDDPFLVRLAAAENRESGYALADYRELLAGIYADVRQDESRRLADTIGRTLFGTLRTQNPDIVTRGVMTAPFVVLVATEMPAVLAEVACLSNDREARLLALPRYRQSIAEALFAGIRSYAAGLRPSTPEEGSPP